MKKLTGFFLFMSFALFGFSQSGGIKGQVTDETTGEPLMLVNVSTGKQGVTTDFNGFYELKLPKGKYDVRFSYIGYDDVLQTVTVGDAFTELNIKMGGSLILDEVTITADIAVARKTPVAFSNLSTAKLGEELASQDLPMVLNSTPGAYATQSGGGDGDARVSIRGFDQRNIAVMLDGIPVNDMENGWVYWSNWFGLDLVTKTMQVQRGLGASKLAIPSVGGTINILTKGINSKKEIRFQQEVGNNGFTRSTLGITTGRLKNGWGVSAALSYKQGDGWVDGTFTQGYFYYLRIDKEIGAHLFSLSGFGAPQSHGQRSYLSPMATFDTTFARNQGVETSQFPITGVDFGLRYNEHVGIRNGELQNTQINFYHKPQYSLRHSWNPNKRFFLSNVAYLSVGNGGGSRVRGPNLGSDDLGTNGMFDLDAAYQTNQASSIFKPVGLSENYLFASMNNHFWYGLLSTAEFKMNEVWTFSGGIDLRNYEGEHKREVYDLLGGSFIQNTGIVRNFRYPNRAEFVVGDNIEYNYVSYVRWGGIFGMAEYEKGGLSAFVNLSGAQSGYAYEDFFDKKVLNIDGTTYRIGYEDTLTIGDQNYHLNSEGVQNFRIDWIYRPSFTFKTGAAYRFNPRNSVFMNVGYLSRPTRYTNVIIANQNNDLDAIAVQNPKNELVASAELGYNYKSPRFAANVNAYYTNWNNRPLDFLPTVLEDPSDPESDRLPVNVQGLAALHKGIEVDFAFEATDKLVFEGLASIGDWIWNSGDTVILPNGESYSFNAKGVHVGNAAQIQLGGLVRYEPIKGLYFKLKTTYFTKNYSNFNPEDLRDTDTPRDSWKMPAYNLVDFHAGYNFKISRIQTTVRLNILNLLNTTYISDAQNNDSFTQAFNNFDAASAAVFFGQGRRWNVSVGVNF